MAAGEESCQNDPNFAVICSFIGKFGELCGINVSISDLQSMLEDTKEVNETLLELHVQLLRKVKKCYNKAKWEKAIVKFCHTFDARDAWEFERFGYKKAKLSSKLQLLKHLLDSQFESYHKFKSEVNKLPADELRILPIGRDVQGHTYWYQIDEEFNFRLYREVPDEENSWILICKERDEMQELINKLESGENGSNLEEGSSTNISENGDSNLTAPNFEVKKEKLKSENTESSIEFTDTGQVLVKNDSNDLTEIKTENKIKTEPPDQDTGNKEVPKSANHVKEEKTDCNKDDVPAKTSLKAEICAESNKSSNQESTEAGDDKKTSKKGSTEESNADAEAAIQCESKAQDSSKESSLKSAEEEVKNVQHKELNNIEVQSQVSNAKSDLTAVDLSVKGDSLKLSNLSDETVKSSLKSPESAKQHAVDVSPSRTLTIRKLKAEFSEKFKREEERQKDGFIENVTHDEPSKTEMKIDATKKSKDIPKCDESCKPTNLTKQTNHSKVDVISEENRNENLKKSLPNGNVIEKKDKTAEVKTPPQNCKIDKNSVVAEGEKCKSIDDEASKLADDKSKDEKKIGTLVDATDAKKRQVQKKGDVLKVGTSESQSDSKVADEKSKELVKTDKGVDTSKDDEIVEDKVAGNSEEDETKKTDEKINVTDKSMENETKKAGKKVKVVGKSKETKKADEKVKDTCQLTENKKTDEKVETIAKTTEKEYKKADKEIKVADSPTEDENQEANEKVKVVGKSKETKKADEKVEAIAKPTEKENKKADEEVKVVVKSKETKKADEKVEAISKPTGKENKKADEEVKVADKPTKDENQKANEKVKVVGGKSKETKKADEKVEAVAKTTEKENKKADEEVEVADKPTEDENKKTGKKVKVAGKPTENKKAGEKVKAPAKPTEESKDADKKTAGKLTEDGKQKADEKVKVDGKSKGKKKADKGIDADKPTEKEKKADEKCILNSEKESKETELETSKDGTIIDEKKKEGEEVSEGESAVANTSRANQSRGRPKGKRVTRQAVSNAKSATPIDDCNDESSKIAEEEVVASNGKRPPRGKSAGRSHKKAAAVVTPPVDTTPGDSNDGVSVKRTSRRLQVLRTKQIEEQRELEKKRKDEEAKKLQRELAARIKLAASASAAAIDVKTGQNNATDEKRGRRGRKKKNQEDEDSMPAQPEKKKKKKKKKSYKKGSKPWDVSSDGSSSDEEEDIEPEEEEEEPEDDLKFDPNYDEFAPEDIDESEEPVVVKRARTLKKEDGTEDEENDDVPCGRCGKFDHPEWILLCDDCDSGFHASCLRPPLMIIPVGSWFCPPCEHKQLCRRLLEELGKFDSLSKKREAIQLRKQRLAYVGISLDNVLKPEDKAAVKEEKSKQQNSEEESSSESEGSSREESGTDDDEGLLYSKRTCRSRQDVSYRFNDYDELINSAILEEEADNYGGLGKGKDMANITNAEKEDNDEVAETKASRKKKRHGINDLSATDEDDSGEEYKGSDDSASELEQSDDGGWSGASESDQSWMEKPRRSRSRRAATRKKSKRSNKKRKRRSKYDEYETEESEESDDYVEKRSSTRKRINYKESSEDSDPEFKWKPSSVKTYSRSKKRIRSSSESESEWRSKKKKSNHISDLEDEDSESTEESSEDEALPSKEVENSKLKTRKKKINFSQMVGSDDEDDDQDKKKSSKPKDDEKDDDESSELEGSSSSDESGPVSAPKEKKPLVNRKRIIESDEESAGASNDAEVEQKAGTNKENDTKNESPKKCETKDVKTSDDSSPSAAKVPKLETPSSPKSNNSFSASKSEKTALETLSRFDPEFSDHPTPVQPVKVEESSPSANSSPSQFTVLGEKPKSSNVQNYGEYSSPNRPPQFTGQYCPQGFQNDSQQRPMPFPRMPSSQPGFNSGYSGPFPPGNPPARPPFDSSNSPAGYNYPEQPPQRFSPSAEQTSGPYPPGSPSQYHGSYAYNESSSRDQNNGRFHIDNILHRQSRAEGGEEDDLSGLTDIVSYITQE